MTFPVINLSVLVENYLTKLHLSNGTLQNTAKSGAHPVLDATRLVQLSSTELLMELLREESPSSTELSRESSSRSLLFLADILLTVGREYHVLSVRLGEEVEHLALLADKAMVRELSERPTEVQGGNSCKGIRSETQCILNELGLCYSPSKEEKLMQNIEERRAAGSRETSVRVANVLHAAKGMPFAFLNTFRPSLLKDASQNGFFLQAIFKEYFSGALSDMPQSSECSKMLMALCFCSQQWMFWVCRVTYWLVCYGHSLSFFTHLSPSHPIFLPTGVLWSRFYAETNSLATFVVGSPKYAARVSEAVDTEKEGQWAGTLPSTLSRKGTHFAYCQGVYKWLALRVEDGSRLSSFVLRVWEKVRNANEPVQLSLAENRVTQLVSEKKKRSHFYEMVPTVNFGECQHVPESELLESIALVVSKGMEREATEHISLSIS